MTFPKKIDHIFVGTVVAYDADTGEVLDVVEKFVETEDGTPGYTKPQITSIECDEIRAEAVRSFPQRRVDVIVGPPEMDQGEDELFCTTKSIPTPKDCALSRSAI